jgi:ketopantoate reductase
MKIAIMGSGGIGGYYGARLQQGGADVTFVARGEHLKAMQANGLALEGERPVHLPKVKATDDPATIGKVDMVIFSVKLRDTESAARQLLPVIGPDTGIISLQNGVQKDDMLAPIVGREHLLGGRGLYRGVDRAAGRDPQGRHAGASSPSANTTTRFPRAHRRSSTPARRARSRPISRATSRWSCGRSSCSWSRCRARPRRCARPPGRSVPIRWRGSS